MCIQYFQKAALNLAFRIVSQDSEMLKILILFLDIYFQLRICVSRSDRPFIVGGIEDIFSALLSTNILSMAVIAILPILIAKCTGN